MRFPSRLAALAAILFSLNSAAQPGTLQPEQRDWLRRQAASAAAPAFQAPRRDLLRETDPAFFRTDEALRRCV